jgi:hypothetical protein
MNTSRINRTKRRQYQGVRPLRNTLITVEAVVKSFEVPNATEKPLLVQDYCIIS